MLCVFNAWSNLPTRWLRRRSIVPFRSMVHQHFPSLCILAKFLQKIFLALTQTLPKGYEHDNPNIDLLRLRSYTVGKPLSDEILLSPDAQERIESLIEVLVPFVSGPLPLPFDPSTPPSAAFSAFCNHAMAMQHNDPPTKLRVQQPLPFCGNRSRFHTSLFALIHPLSVRL